MPVKVLVVEDDVFLMKAYTLKLTNSGFELQTARNGQEAIDILKTYKPDIILLDLVMPVKDGFVTLQEIKQNDDWKNIPVIVTSNLAQQSDVDRVKGLGATDMITKSDMSMEDLIKRINKVVAGG